MRLGCDPEIFLQNHRGLVSVVGLVEGNKEHPYQIPGLPPGFTLQQDNVAMEMGIPPAADKKQWVEYLTTVKRAAKNHVRGLSFSPASCAVFPPEEMQTAEANVFGCEPDFNAWTGQKNPKPKPPHIYMRSAGGHVHVETDLDKWDVIKAMDLHLGLESLLLDKTGEQRRELYGKAGAFRPKSYGVEYRTLSNFWLFKTQYMIWVWEQTEKALAYAKKNDSLHDERIREAIDTNNITLAKVLIKEYAV